MPRRKYEKPQAGNPNRLPVRQHIFPLASIQRFVDQTGRVDLLHLPTSRTWKAGASDDIFCALRAWDARSETGYMKQIEDRFQCLADRVIAEAITQIEGVEAEKVNQFLALWQMRAFFRDMDVKPVNLKGIGGGACDKNREELLETVGMASVREGGFIPGHQLNGVQIELGLMQQMINLSKLQWAIVHAKQGQFVVPDFPSLPVVPIGPKLCLFGFTGHSPKRTAIADVSNVNRHLRANSKVYYFANDFRLCP